MGVDHRGAQLLVAEQLLNGPDVIAVRQKMSRERVAVGVTGDCQLQLAAISKAWWILWGLRGCRSMIEGLTISIQAIYGAGPDFRRCYWLLPGRGGFFLTPIVTQ